MTSSLLKIAGGTVYDPANGVDGQVRDIWIRDGKIVAAPTDPAVRADRTIDARGLVVMPGGVDMHCHIAGPKVNVARKMRPEEKRLAPPVRRTANTHSGTMGSVPSTFATGYKYAGMGYTTAFDAADSAAGGPARARGIRRHALHRQGLLRPDGQQPLRHAGHPATTSPSGSRRFMAWLLSAAKGYAAKMVNPGGVEVWKQQQAGNVSALD